MQRHQTHRQSYDWLAEAHGANVREVLPPGTASSFRRTPGVNGPRIRNRFKHLQLQAVDENGDPPG